jgi:hypothetical protein
VLILPPGHAQTLRERRTYSVREKWLFGGVLGLVAALAVVLAISLSTAEPRSANGCISVGLSYATGGQRLSRCGAGARAFCAEAGVAGGITGTTGRAVATQCRKAGLPVG